MGMKLIRIGLILCIVGVIHSACSEPAQTSMQAAIPSPSPSIPNVPSSPTESANSGISKILDYEVDPLYGLADLQRGFSPDPYIVGVGAGGTFDTSVMNLACGFTTDAPTFVFNLSGGASEGFLRIYFVSSDDGMDTRLIVHTPNQEWICKDNSSNSSGAGPVLDIEYAASGKYTIWVGMPQSDAYAPGMLFITESANNTP
ncbi:MAG: hypothetical protein C4545_02535 [Anaerolineaceae bacterium]|jgi:hypothetical protein|nr:MAG: hypothetical protein C4545_02535 [Anaerolineaceae bacterium]